VLLRLPSLRKIVVCQYFCHLLTFPITGRWPRLSGGQELQILGWSFWRRSVQVMRFPTTMDLETTNNVGDLLPFED
jgi:hypothetical protein